MAEYAAPQEANKSHTTRNIIIAVVVLLFLCCCCAAVMGGIPAILAMIAAIAEEMNF